MRINSQKFAYIFLLVSTVSTASLFKPFGPIFKEINKSNTTITIYSDGRIIGTNPRGTYGEQLNDGCEFVKNGLGTEIYANAAGQEVYRKTNDGIVTEDGDTKEFRQQFLYFNKNINQSLVKIEEPSLVQITKVKDAQCSYNEIFNAIDKNHCKGFRRLVNDNCDNCNKDPLVITEQDGLSFIQSLGNDASPINKAIGHAVIMSLAINYEWPWSGLLRVCIENKISIDNFAKLDDLTNFNRTLSVDDYINHLKAKNKPYYKLLQNQFDETDVYSLWHINNIVFLDSYALESPKELLEYVKLHTHIKKLHSCNNHSFVMIIKQAKGDPFQVLVFKIGDKINILTTQAVTHYFEKFMISLFGSNATTNKFLENRIMRLEIDNHKNLTCLTDVVRTLGINKEFF